MSAGKRRAELQETEHPLVEECPHRRCRRVRRCRGAVRDEWPIDEDALRRDLAERIRRLGEERRQEPAMDGA